MAFWNNLSKAKKQRIGRMLICCMVPMLLSLMPVHVKSFDMGSIERTHPISAGGGPTAAISKDGTLWTWGHNQAGQLGNGGEVYSNVPIKIMDNVVSVSVGGVHTAAITKEGALWLWGRNYCGQLGTASFSGPQPFGFNDNSYVPVKVMENVVAVSCGDMSTAAIQADGSLWMWGDNSDGQIGNGGVGNATLWTGDIVQTAPVKVMDNVVSVSVGTRCAAAITKDGALWMWGSNRYGEFGNGTTISSSVPVKVMDNVVAVSVAGHVGAIKADGSLWMWGSNDAGQLGTGSLEDSRVPVKVLDDVVSVSVGNRHTAAIKSDSSLWMWGDNSDGQLGNGGNGNSRVKLEAWGVILSDKQQTLPVKVMDNVADVSAGYGYTEAVKKDGTLWTWGSNYEGSLGIGAAEDSSIPQKVMENIALPNSRTLQLSLSGFDDVREDDWFAPYVQWAVKNNITAGTTSSAFSPNNTCTVAQILTFLWRAEGSPEPNIENPFSDVKPGDYFYKPALWANENGLVTGFSFNGGTPCTRATTVSYLWKLTHRPTVDSINPFTDVAPEADYAQAVTWAVAQGITSGTSATTFSPSQICTRAQIVAFLYRYYH